MQQERTLCISMLIQNCGSNNTRGGSWLSGGSLLGQSTFDYKEEIVFKMDTGAEVTVISEKVYCTLKKTKLEKPAIVLYGSAHQPLEVLGQFSERLMYGEHSHSEDIFVVRDLHNNLLGLTAITGLHLIQRVNATPSRISWDLGEIPKGLHWTWNPWRGLYQKIEGRCTSVCTVHTSESTLLSMELSSRWAQLYGSPGSDIGEGPHCGIC